MPVYRSRSLFNERNNTRKIVFDGVRLRVLPPVGCRPYRVIISCGCVVRVVIISPPGIRVRLSSCYVRVALGYTPLVRTNKSLSLMIVCRPVHHATSTTGYTTSQAPLDQQGAQTRLWAVSYWISRHSAGKLHFGKGTKFVWFTFCQSLLPFLRNNSFLSVHWLTNISLRPGSHSFNVATSNALASGQRRSR